MLDVGVAKADIGDEMVMVEIYEVWWTDGGRGMLVQGDAHDRQWDLNYLCCDGLRMGVGLGWMCDHAITREESDVS